MHSPDNIDFSIDLISKGRQRKKLCKKPAVTYNLKLSIDKFAKFFLLITGMKMMSNLRYTASALVAIL